MTKQLFSIIIITFTSLTRSMEKYFPHRNQQHRRVSTAPRHVNSVGLRFPYLYSEDVLRSRSRRTDMFELLIQPIGILNYTRRRRLCCRNSPMCFVFRLSVHQERCTLPLNTRKKVSDRLRSLTYAVRPRLSGLFGT